MLGGEITVDSALGQGSVFTVLLPCNLQEDEELAAEADSQAALFETAPVTGEAPTVLVIDDDRIFRELLLRFLEKDGFRVITASDGTEGLRLAREHRPALVTLDIVIPGLDGWGVLKGLKADRDLASIPVMMITIVDNPGLGHSLGAVEYFTKPIDWRRLATAMAKYRSAGSRRPASTPETRPSA
jgi:DNA-binding response OmpR family regulator